VNNIEMNREESGLASDDSEQGPLACPCEYGNGSSRSIKDAEFLDKLSD